MLMLRLSIGERSGVAQKGFSAPSVVLSAYLLRLRTMSE